MMMMMMMMMMVVIAGIVVMMARMKIFSPTHTTGVMKAMPSSAWRRDRYRNQVITQTSLQLDEEEEGNGGGDDDEDAG